MFDWSIALEAAKSGGELILEPSTRRVIIQKLYTTFRSNRVALLYGTSGSGKSQIVRSLEGSLEVQKSNLTTVKTRYDLDLFPVLFRDTPGHGQSDPFRAQEFERIIRGGVDGIINVVSYGYQESSFAKKQIAIDEHGDVKQDFVLNNRSDEVTRLDEWLPKIRPTHVKWIITIVNKADIWWPEYETVEKHYKEGSYAEKFKALSGFVPCLIMPYCSIIRPFFHEQTSGRFGEEEKAALQSLFLKNFHGLLEHGASK